MATELVSFRLVIVVEYGSTLPGMGVFLGFCWIYLAADKWALQDSSQPTNDSGSEAVFSFLYLKKIKISKIYVRFGKFQKYTPVALP